jgi:hypothetical protein
MDTLYYGSRFEKFGAGAQFKSSRSDASGAFLFSLEHIHIREKVRKRLNAEFFPSCKSRI